MKTAVEWLYNELSKNNTSTDSVIERINKESSIWKQAKEMEKEQIENAHAHHRCIHDKTMECTIEAYKSAEKYYNQTYKPETI